MTLKITVLTEDTNCMGRDLKTEKGLSYFVEHNQERIIFDTGGPDGTIIQNAIDLGVDLKTIDRVILSHGHYDHTGGLLKLVDLMHQPVKLTVHHTLFHKRYKITDKETKFIGNDFSEEDLLQRDVDLQIIFDTTQINENLFVVSNFESGDHQNLEANHLYVEKDQMMKPDYMEGELVLVIQTEKGLVILLGCAHSGILTILNKIQEKFAQPILGIIGGTHLGGVSEGVVHEILDEIDKLEFQWMGPCHCTGQEVIKKMKNRLGDRFKEVHVGTEIILDND